MSTFIDFKKAVQQQIKIMSDSTLFKSSMNNYDLADLYLASFPEGSDPLFRERTEHDCSCCKAFIRNVGGVLAIIDNQLVSIWDINIGGHYQVVADALSKAVKQAGIDTIYLNDTKRVGVDFNYETMADHVHTWHHFYTKLPESVVEKEANIATRQGQAKTNKQCLKRSVEEITPEAIDIVLDLIAQNSIYRGEEFKSIVEVLKTKQIEYKASTNPDIYLWEASIFLADYSNIRGTMIGTLLQDISDGVELEKAVKSYEAKAAPENYRRTTALITQRMIDTAMKTVDELGIQNSFVRRFAQLNDITINNVLFADRSVLNTLSSGLLDTLAPTAANKPNFDKVAEMSYLDFVNDVLPKVTSVEIFVENRHENNLVSLVAPTYEDSPKIFKWDNNFSWSYKGEVTDSIKERVKAAGGNVEGDLTISLSWHNKDDLDLHVKTSTSYIFFGSRMGNRCGGRLDIDANRFGGDATDSPVENIYWNSVEKIPQGTITIDVNNYSKRSNQNIGFDLRVDYKGHVTNFTHDKALPDGKTIRVAELLKNKQGDIEIKSAYTPMTESHKAKDMWGVTSGDFRPVEAIMYSPNHWDDNNVGNKHIFFMLKDAHNDQPVRGFYNEFLTDNLNKHRKVFEVLASKSKAQPTPNQLSGLGFSTTKQDYIVCRVSGSFNRIIKVIF